MEDLLLTSKGDAEAPYQVLASINHKGKKFVVVADLSIDYNPCVYIAQVINVFGAEYLAEPEIDDYEELAKGAGEYEEM